MVDYKENLNDHFKEEKKCGGTLKHNCEFRHQCVYIGTVEERIKNFVKRGQQGVPALDEETKVEVKSEEKKSSY